MTPFSIGESLIGPGCRCFFIAEIGQNHQGDLDLAKQMILSAKNVGADCVKFQKSSLNKKFTKSALERPYVSPNAWASTYGEHKEYLEFSMDEYRELQSYANRIGVLFTASAMDLHSFHQLLQLDVPFIKIGSGDANNFPMLEYAASEAVPLVISTGMQTSSTVDRIVDIMQHKKNVCLMHCVSSYPTQSEDVSLNMIKMFANKYENTIWGYSGHELGISISTAAALVGAHIIERHFTLDKSWKGSDHNSSLTPFEFGKMIRNVRLLENNNCISKSQVAPINVNELLIILKSLNHSNMELNNVKMALRNETPSKKILKCEISCLEKLGKSLVYACELPIGHQVRREDLDVKVSEPNGIPADSFYDVIGKCLFVAVKEDEPAFYWHFK